MISRHSLHDQQVIGLKPQLLLQTDARPIPLFQIRQAKLARYLQHYDWRQQREGKKEELYHDMCKAQP
jgi:hypothetical protein